MIDGLVAGRLYGEAERRTDKAGKTFALAKVRASTADGEVLFVNIMYPGMTLAIRGPWSSVRT